jgi:hypothetical protein
VDISAVRMVLADAASAVVLPAGALTATWFLPDAVTEPHFFVAEYDQTFDSAHNRAMDDLTFTCRALVGRADERSAQYLMDALFSGSGAASLKAAIEAIRGQGGALQTAGADDLRVVRTQANRLYEHAGTQYVGGELIVRVIGPGG